jgi:glycosyltransferase involved in cell wall biosynthesis
MAQAIAIDYVSPLPPVRSGISDYSRDLLPYLEDLCDLRVIRLNDQPLAAELVQRWQPVDSDQTGLDNRLALYQVGNNRYHEVVVALAVERPGVVVLHDVILHHLLVESTLGRSELDPYLQRLEADHGWVGCYAAKARRWGELGQAAMFGLTANRSLLRSQKGVLVHSHWALDRVREDDPDLPVRWVPMGIPLPPRLDLDAGVAFRQRLGLDKEAQLIGSFGFQTPIKRTEKVIEALAQPGLEQTHLLIAGEVSPVLDFEAVAAEAGVSDRVHSTGFLDYSEFEDAIAGCDLCVNLRYPTAGETSASLLRVLALGRPAIVSDYAHGAELPDTVAVKVPLGDGEVEALAGQVGRLLRDRARLDAMSRSAREYVERENDPRQAAAAVVEACQEFQTLEPNGYSIPALPPPSTLVWRQIAAELHVDGGRPPWPEGSSRKLRIRLVNHGPARWLATIRGTGGVMVQIHWRVDPWSEEQNAEWIYLPHDIEPGESYDCEISTRRPIGASMLVIEPHLKGIAGFNALGGPKWLRFL